MKVCPTCSFSNEERFPTCLVCNTLLVDVRSIPVTDPNHPEFARQTRDAARRRVTRRQLCWAAICYVAIITLTAVWPGLILRPTILSLYAGSSVMVVLAVLGDVSGQMTSGVLQGLLSVVLVYYFGPSQPFVIFMLVAHTILPTVLWHWVEMIHDGNR